MLAKQQSKVVLRSRRSYSGQLLASADRSQDYKKLACMYKAVLLIKLSIDYLVKLRLDSSSTQGQADKLA